MRRTRAHNAILDVRAAILLVRMLLRMRAGHAPWYSRSRARIRSLTRARFAR